jgi:two-component system, cell cycle sensor histidine kinase and response regulator CckA
LPGRGTTISVYLPAASGVAALSGDAIPAQMPKGDGEFVLLVDDESATLEVTRLLLEAYGYNVATATNGEEAVARYREHRAGFNAVITDMMMPVMDGPNTIEALREIDPAVRIIGISGLLPGSPSLDVGQRKLHAFLKKPFSTAALLSTLQGVCKSNEGPA